ncbi:MAG: hypothetical protein R3E82_19525 [Pseudomonadales bacterium]
MQDQANFMTPVTEAAQDEPAPESTELHADSTAPMNADPLASAEALQRELAKWQERVPKLAAALRQRTSEVEALRAQLSAAGNAGATTENLQTPARTTPGIEARDALIRELEAKLKALNSKHQDAQGQLHVRDMEIAELRQDAGEWREKWQQVTSSLDAQTDAASEKETELSRLRAETAELRAINEELSRRTRSQDIELTGLRESSQSLESRNAKLFETTELANRQIESLGVSLEQLRDHGKKQEAELVKSRAQLQQLREEQVRYQEKLASRDQDIEFLHGHVETKQQEINRLNDEVAALEQTRAERERLEAEAQRRNGELESLRAEIAVHLEQIARLQEVERSAASARAEFDAAQAALVEAQESAAALRAQIESRDATLAEQSTEIARLEDCVTQAGERIERRESERRTLSEQLDELKSRNEHLEAQLAERSNLVVGLEQERNHIHSETSDLKSENQRLSEALEKAQRNAAEHSDHVAQLDARLDRQKELMTRLEEEFAQVQEDYAQAVKSHKGALEERAAAVAELESQLALANASSREAAASIEAAASGASDRLALEAALAEVRESQEAAVQAQNRAETRAEQLARENEQLRSQQDAARKSLAEKIEQLENQLSKQSRLAAEAEAAAASARAALDEAGRAARADPDDTAGELLELQQEVLKLEGMVRDRTEQLNKARWQQEMLEKQTGAEGGSEGKMLVVLNQQLQSARDDNRRLLEKVETLEAALSERPGTADDLTCIRGIGPKLAAQLEELGITRFDQIAALSEALLEDDAHPLHGLRGRILKDGWIEQAIEALG